MVVRSMRSLVSRFPHQFTFNFATDTLPVRYRSLRCVAVRYASAKPTVGPYQVGKRKTGARHDGHIHVFKPTVTLPIREVEQAVYLTKAIVKDKKPLVFEEDCKIDSTSLNELVESCKRNILQTRSFFADDKEEYNIIRREKAKDKDAALKSFINFLRIVSLTANKWYPNYHKHCLCYRVGIANNWKRDGLDHPIQVSSRVGYVLYRKKLLAPFWNAEEVTKSSDISITWEFLTSPTFHIPSESGIHLRVDSGFDAGIPYPCPNTFILTEIDGKTVLSGLGKGIMFAHATASSFAVDNGLVSDDGTLTTPVPIQFILIDARQLKLVCYQLNTMDMESNEGVKNFLWFKDSQLFEKPVLREKLRKRAFTDDLTKFDPEGIEVLIKFLLNGA